MPLAVEIQDLERRFGDVHAVRGLDLQIEEGTCFGLLGPNGAGKSTTIHILVGLDQPTSGSVSVFGSDVRTGRKAISQRIGVQLQETQFVEKLKVDELLRLFQSFYAAPRSIDDVRALVGLDEKRTARYRTLSGGQKQRLALGCALIGDPELLVLDEPTTGLDPQARRRMWEIIDQFRQDGGTILLTTHYMDEAEKLCDQIVVIDHGRAIASGTPRELIRSLGADVLVEFETRIDFELDQLAQLAGVAHVEQIGSTIRLRSDSTSSVLTEVLEWYSARDDEPVDLRTHRTNLEDVFVHLTGRSLRDG